MNNFKVIRNLVSLLLVVFFVAGCANKSGLSTAKNPNQGRYKVTKDYGPDAVVDVSHISDAIPVVEPRSRGGNRSQYEVLGKVYSVMPSSAGFKERGGASWYGKKFHGYKTANGDKYDMYGMSAAHKSLPIPTYVTVTNLANQKQVIVRVNDRGPFHKGRVIDLSYAAAAKLGMLDNGTAQVEIAAIDPKTWNGSKGIKKAVASNKKDKSDQPFVMKSADKPQVVDNLNSSVVEVASTNGDKVEPVKQMAQKLKKKQAAAPVTYNKPVATSDKYIGVHYIQVGVYSTEEAAHNVTLKVKKFDIPVLISELSKDGRNLSKVIIGPMQSRKNTEKVKAELLKMGFPGAHLMDLPN